MTVMLRKHGKEKCPDWERIAEGLPPALVAVLWNVLEDVIEHRDSTVVLQMYAALANRWRGMSAKQRKEASEEGEERYFTEDAFERDDAERRAARAIVDEPEAEGRIILLDGGTPERPM
jgi:hypothetical protein